MSFQEIAKSLPGGAGALNDILANPQIAAMAKSAGIDLSNPEQLSSLLTQVKARVEATAGMPMEQIKAVNKPSRAVHQYPQSSMARQAIATYRSVAAMI